VNTPKIIFIGGGNMAYSLIGGLLEQGHPVQQIAACDPVAHSRQRLEQDFGITTYSDNLKAAEADVLILAVKPQIIKSVATELARMITHNPLVISIAAGISTTALQSWLGGQVAIVRCMPNTPALLQKGAAGLFATANVTEAQRTLAKEIISAVGLCFWFETEIDIDRATALSGSGPAYFFLVMEAMEDAAVSLGMDRNIARRLTVQTALGAASMAAQSNLDTAELRRQVTSPGGTTERAVNELVTGGLPELFEQAIQSAFRRAKEMAEETL
jgi:pyrroline-5-carboxylate reductase